MHTLMPLPRPSVPDAKLGRGVSETAKKVIVTLLLQFQSLFLLELVANDGSERTL